LSQTITIKVEQDRSVDRLSYADKDLSVTSGYADGADNTFTARSSYMDFKNILLGHRSAIRIVFLSLFSIFFGIAALSAPILEWDMLAYVANAAKNVTDLSLVEIHQMVYSNLKATVPAEDYQRLIGSDTRAVLANNAEAFGQTSVFFYDTRVVYIGMLSGLMHLGMEPFFASYFISTICMIICIFALASLLPATLPFGVCFSLPFVAVSCGMFELARGSTPDALATLYTVVLYWVLLRSNRYLLLLLPASIFIRTDLILVAVFFYGYLYITNRFPRVLVVISGLATLTAYWLLNNYIVQGDPWSSLIGYNFGEKPTHPETYSFTVTIGNYISYLLDGLRAFSYEPRFFMICALAMTGLFMFSARFIYHPDKSVSLVHKDILFILVSSILSIGAHFLLFPVNWIRFYAAQYSLIMVVVLWTALILLAQRNYTADADAEIIKPELLPADDSMENLKDG